MSGGLSLAGFAVTVAFFCLSLTPSLLPRAWLLQGMVSGITAAMGYALGATVGALAGLLWDPAARVRRVVWWVVLVGAPVLVVVFLWLGARWQRALRARLGAEPLEAYDSLLIVTVAVLTFALILLVARGLRLATHEVARLLGRFAPRPVAYCTGFVVVAALAVSLVDRVVLDAMFAAADETAAVTNDGTDSHVVTPASALRSGGPFSLAGWETLGRQGRDFVGTGPSRDQLAAFARRPALEPIRVYVGLDSADTTRARADLVVREMDRTGAFDRTALAVLIPTGTGWVNSAVADSLEYMYAGDTALVSMQYSYLPSWISFLADRTEVIETSAALITAVRDRWAALPAATRPKLLIFGASLGTLGTEKAFGDVRSMIDGADGVLLEGPTFANPIRNELIAARRPGTRIWDPIYDPQPVEFAARAAELRAPVQPAPQVVYLQNSSDPVVWWSPYLLVQKPDWLDEPRGPDLSPDMHWYPGITFWQTTVDLAFAKSAPAGHGHVYGSGVVDGWAVLAPPPGWTTADTIRLRALLDA